MCGRKTKERRRRERDFFGWLEGRKDFAVRSPREKERERREEAVYSDREYLKGG